MHDIQKTALNRLLSVLTGLKAEYRINLPDGTTYGTLEVKAPEAPRASPRKSAYPHGERSTYAQALIGDMYPGDVRRLGNDVYPQKIIAATLSSTAHRLWGSGNYVVQRCADGIHTEILRTA